MHYNQLNPSAWEYQSAVLDCIYRTARLSGTATGNILDITQWYLIKTLWHLELFLTASGNVYQWSTEPYMEKFNKHTPVQFLKILTNLTKRSLILYTVILLST